MHTGTQTEERRGTLERGMGKSEKQIVLYLISTVIQSCMYRILTLALLISVMDFNISEIGGSPVSNSAFAE